MEFPKRERAFLQGSPRRSPKTARPGAATGADENASPKHLVPVGAASPQRKKVLGERNGRGVGVIEGAASPPVQQPKPAPSPPTLAGRGAGPYDPRTNYTTPRPSFLRYDPERRREILLRVSRAAEVICDDCSSTTSLEDGGSSLASDAAAESPISSAPRSDSEAELSDSEDEEEVVPARQGLWARRLFLLFVAVSCCFCYMYCVNPSSFPTYSEYALNLDRGIGGMYDNRASPRNLVAVTVMGLADICLNVSLGELTCQIGSERSENVADLREDSEIDKFDTEVAVSFQNDKQSGEVDWLDGNAPLDSISSTTTQTNEEGSHTNEEEGSSESVHLEEWSNCSNQCVLQLVSMEKAIKSASHKMEDRKVESEDLDLWQYENTAEAAKTICSAVKFLWSAMEPHLLQILACLSFAGLVTALYRCYQRSRGHSTCVTTYDSLPEESLVVPHQLVSVTSSPKVPMELTLPKLDQLVSLKDHVQESLPTLKVPVIGKLKQGDSENIKTSNGMFLNHSDVDSSKPPVVELLGEFMFANSSRGRPIKSLNQNAGGATVEERSIKSLNQNAGDATVEELLKHLGKDEDVKMQMHSSIIQSPSVRRAKKEQEKSVKREKTDATPTLLTPTPLRRSSRLRNKVTTP